MVAGHKDHDSELAREGPQAVLEELALVRDVADQKKYMAWRQERGDLDQMGKALREPPILRTMDMMDI